METFGGDPGLSMGTTEVSSPDLEPCGETYVEGSGLRDSENGT